MMWEVFKPSLIHYEKILCGDKKDRKSDAIDAKNDQKVVARNSTVSLAQLKAVRRRHRGGVKAEGTYDKNWLYTSVVVKAGAFNGKYNAYFQTADFQTLRDQLLGLYNDLSSQFQFTTLESQLQLDLRGDGIGHITIDAMAQDEAGNGNILNFQLNIDQTYLQDCIYQLDCIIKDFPYK